MRYVYCASALSGLSQEQRRIRDADVAVVAAAARVAGLACVDPTAFADPASASEVSPHELYAAVRSRVLSASAFALLCRNPSFGAGQELEMAAHARIPLILLVPLGVSVSRMVYGADTSIEIVIYGTASELRVRLAAHLCARFGRPRE